jgi:hypothetical protein
VPPAHGINTDCLLKLHRSWQICKPFVIVSIMHVYSLPFHRFCPIALKSFINFVMKTIHSDTSFLMQSVDDCKIHVDMFLYHGVYDYRPIQSSQSVVE